MLSVVVVYALEVGETDTGASPFDGAIFLQKSQFVLHYRYFVANAGNLLVEALQLLLPLSHFLACRSGVGEVVHVIDR